MENYQFQIIGKARQTILSYSLTVFLISIFLILNLLRKRGLKAIEVEIVLLPLFIDSLQKIALENIYLRSQVHRHLKVFSYLLNTLSLGILRIKSQF